MAGCHSKSTERERQREREREGEREIEAERERKRERKFLPVAMTAQSIIILVRRLRIHRDR